MTVHSSAIIADPRDGLSRYFTQIQSYPMLTREEEYTYACRYRDEEDQDAVHRLVTSHLRLVAKIASGYRGYGLPLEEVISEGNVGLMQAVKRFDPDRGFRLSTYAIWWIRSAIQEYVLRSWSLVKVGTTVAQKKLFFNLRKMMSKLRQEGAGGMTPENIAEIAERLDVPERDVISMNQRMAGHDHSLNAPISSEGAREWQDCIEDREADHESDIADREEGDVRRELLREAMKDLKDREREILVARRLRDKPLTLEVLSERYDISRERVRQIEVRAFDKVRKAVHSRIMKRDMVM